MVSLRTRVRKARPHIDQYEFHDSPDAFYNEDAWREDEHDSDWSFHSSSAESSSAESGSELALSESSSEADAEAEASAAAADAAERRLLRKFDYEKVVRRNLQRSRESTREWSVIAQPVAFANGVLADQAYMLRQARENERANRERLAQYQREISDANQRAMLERASQAMQQPFARRFVSYVDAAEGRALEREFIIFNSEKSGPSRE